MTARPVQRAGFADIDRVVLHDVLRLRSDVFVVEQACVYPDLDGIDIDPSTTHWWIEEHGAVVAYLRTREGCLLYTSPSPRD